MSNKHWTPACFRDPNIPMVTKPCGCGPSTPCPRHPTCKARRAHASACTIHCFKVRQSFVDGKGIQSLLEMVADCTSIDVHHYPYTVLSQLAVDGNVGRAIAHANGFEVLCFVSLRSALLWWPATHAI